MTLSVENRAEKVATFRFIHVFLMETLARWVPMTPEMEVKVILGRHIWDLAQQADALGKRTYELRAPLQFSLRPLDRYARFLEEFARTTATSEKIHGFYEVMLPALAVRYRAYLDQTDRLLDEPTVRIVERILGDFTRMESESQRLLDELPELRPVDQTWLAGLRKLEAAETDIVASRPATAVA
ncbi:MAG: hypothetical protein DMG70_07010 [Acidobacteria bacterium]|nr:MAG: hypothetical protein DMG70_07010 [Acidobacteriota bacterium]PYY07404.1 MAG: hypothetical protein DMG69_19590 [Acidobacteriota bacterium]